MRVVCQERAEVKTAGKKRVEVEGRPARRLECARRQKGARRQEGARIARRQEGARRQGDARIARRQEGARRQGGARIARRQEGARRQKGAQRRVLFTCVCMNWSCRSHDRCQECRAKGWLCRSHDKCHEFGQEDGMGYLDTGAARACPRSGFVGNPADGRPSKIRGDPETTREPQKQRRCGRG